MKNYCIFLILILAVGCGSQNVPVTGTVSFDDGLPLTKGAVALSTDVLSFTGTVGTDGKFSMGQTEDGQGIPAGTYKVSVSSLPALGEAETIVPDSAEPKTIEVKKGDKTHLTITVKKAK